MRYQMDYVNVFGMVLFATIPLSLFFSLTLSSLLSLPMRSHSRNLSLLYYHDGYKTGQPASAAKVLEPHDSVSGRVPVHLCPLQLQ